MSYTYSPELKAPQRVPEIDPLKPAMAGMLKILVLTHRKQTSAFQAPDGLSVRMVEIANVPCFVVEPNTAETESMEQTPLSDVSLLSRSPLPGVLLIHGGAFYLPVQTTALHLACEYAKGLNAKVVVPDYSLVPQHKAPSQLEECLAVWKELAENGKALGIDPAKVVVMGDSAGAALAACLCLYLRDHASQAGADGLPKGQLLIYPVLDDREERYESYRLFANAAWSERCNRLMWDAYLKDAEDSWLPYLVPLRQASLAALPRTYIEPQEIDVLRDEGIAFAKALEEAGVETELNVVEGSYHNFDSDLTSPLVQRAVQRRIQAARAMLKS